MELLSLKNAGALREIANLGGIKKGADTWKIVPERFLEIPQLWGIL